MDAQLELVQGDMFEGPTDLVVIPCSTRPTVSRLVGDRFRAFQISPPDRPMRAGEVIFQPLASARQIAPYAAFAATVNSDRRTEMVSTHSIGASLGRFCSENDWVERVSCPLLGSGAGNVRAEQSIDDFLAGFRSSFQREGDVLLRVFALYYDVFERVREHLRRPADSRGPVESATRPVRVFVSYTKTDEKHAKWVAQLARGLREKGIEARIDEWYLRPGMDVNQWMCNELDMADRVLLVCDEFYSQKADRRHGGVGWEIRLVQGEIAAHQESNPDKFVPIVRTELVQDGLPAFLRGVYSVHWPRSVSAARDRELRERLLRDLYRVQEAPPPVGARPSFVTGP